MIEGHNREWYRSNWPRSIPAPSFAQDVTDFVSFDIPFQKLTGQKLVIRSDRIDPTFIVHRKSQIISNEFMYGTFSKHSIRSLSVCALCNDRVCCMHTVQQPSMQHRVIEIESIVFHCFFLTKCCWLSQVSQVLSSADEGEIFPRDASSKLL